MFDMFDIHRVVNPYELPVSIQHLPDCPSILYCVGDVDLLKSPCISVAGSRKIQSKSAAWLRDILPLFDGFTVVSGLAIGADTVAHKEALKLDMPTIAVLPSGVNNIAPAVNEKLADQIVDNGGLLISEYPLHQGPTKSSYVHRSRIIAALGRRIIIPQCDIQSGTMHTANFARDFKKIIVVQDADYTGNQHLIQSDEYFTLIH